MAVDETIAEKVLGIRDCSDCGQKNCLEIIDSRAVRDYVRRRLKCKSCGFRFTTREMRETFFLNLAFEKRVSGFETVFLEMIKKYFKSLSPEAQILFFDSLENE